MNTSTGAVVAPDELHELLYAWETSEDVLGSIATSSDAAEVRQALFDPAAAAPTPAGRTIRDLRVAIGVIERILDTPEATAWGDSMEARSLPNGQSLSLRQHRLLALRSHLDWICSTFENMPNVFVTVR
jgi:hypothetical protein